MLKLLYVPDVTMCLITVEHRGAVAHVCAGHARQNEERDVRDVRDVLICTFDT